MRTSYRIHITHQMCRIARIYNPGLNQCSIYKHLKIVPSGARQEPHWNIQKNYFIYALPTKQLLCIISVVPLSVLNNGKFINNCKIINAKYNYNKQGLGEIQPQMR